LRRLNHPIFFRPKNEATFAANHGMDPYWHPPNLSQRLAQSNLGAAGLNPEILGNFFSWGKSVWTLAGCDSEWRAADPGLLTTQITKLFPDKSSGPSGITNRCYKPETLNFNP